MRLLLVMMAMGGALGAGFWLGNRRLAPVPSTAPPPATRPAASTPGTAQPSPAAKTPSSAHEVWVAWRTDGQPGTGLVTDPFNGNGVNKLNALFEKFRKEYGDNLTVHFGPGTYVGDRPWAPANNWHLLGAGRDITVFKTAPNPGRTETVGFRPLEVTGFVLSDVTFDFNVLQLRKANRVFTFPWGQQRRVGYYFAAGLPPWKSGRLWKSKQAATHHNLEYMCVKDTQAEPGVGSDWSVLHSNQPASLPEWKSDTLYTTGDAVALEGIGYICLQARVASSPAGGDTAWERIDPNAPDPSIYTIAAFGGTAWPRSGERLAGGNRVSRVRAVNGYGSLFFDHEDFVIGLGGSDCVIEDCVVERFHGDYGSLIVLMNGRNSVVRGCTVRGNGRCIAYGGWACFDTLFENNFCENVDAGANIDSLNNRNVTFRNNTFVNCHGCGIVVNVGGERHQPFPDYWGELDGRRIDLNEHGLDGLYIYGNYIERPDGARYGAIQVQQELLSNVQIHHNLIRTAGGHGRDCAIGVLQARNVSVYANRCDPNMYCQINGVTGGQLCYDNYDFEGKPMKDSAGQPIDRKSPP
jgi:hypothetical protein